MRQFILESSRSRRLEAGFDLLANELQQQQKRLGSQSRLVKSELDSDSTSRGSLRRGTEELRSRITDELDSIKQAMEQEAKRQLSPKGELYLKLEQAVANFSADQIEQHYTGSKIKLSVNEENRLD